MKKIVLLLCAAAASAMSAPGAGQVLPSYAVVASKSVAADPAWRAVADALAAKNGARFATSVVVADPAGAAEALRKAAPRYVAFVLRPEEAGEKTVYALHDMMKSLDDDPFYDAVWGIVTGPSASAAMRLATAEPVHPRTALTTTGVDFRPFSDATTVSDAYAPGSSREEYRRPDRPVAIVEKRGGAEQTTRVVRGDTTAEFVAAWDALDPELLVTSSHASQRNLEMPFSTGNVVSWGGVLRPLPNRRLIDYATGQAKKGGAVHVAGAPLAEPKRDKIWIAAGNCLIGDYKDNDSMAAAMIGYGRVVQFMGYVKTTWFGEIGWETLAQFFERRATVAESWYFAGQNLERKLSVMKKEGSKWRGRDRRGMTYEGRMWDRDATMLWGDPALDARLDAPGAPQAARLTCSFPPTGDVAGARFVFEALEDLEANEDKTEDVHIVHPFGAILPRAGGPFRVEGGEGLGVFAADDFVLVISWPAMKKGDRIEFRLI